MTKVLKCGDLNPGCEFEARGNSEGEVLQAAAKHAKAKHGLSNIPPEMLLKARRFIHDEASRSEKIQS